MSVLKTLKFTTAPRAAAVSPEEQRRSKLRAHLQEQLAMAQAELEGKVHVVKKRHWEHTESGQRSLVETDKRLKRWWTSAADGGLVLMVRWGSKLIEFEKGKAAIAVGDIPGLVATLQKLIAANDDGEFDALIAAVNSQRKAKAA